MPGPKKLREFEKLVKAQGWTIERSKKHHKVVDADGNTVFHFAVTHPGNEVKFNYVRDFMNLIGAPAEPEEEEEP